MQAWLTVLEELGLDDASVDPLKDALQVNDVDRFKEHLSNIWNNLTLREMVKLKVEMAIVGRDAGVSSISNGTPGSMVSMMAIVVCAVGVVFQTGGGSTLGAAFFFIALLTCLAFRSGRCNSGAPPGAIVDPRTSTPKAASDLMV